MKREILRSSDGSYTLKLSDFNESYHSVNGALNESRHIYIDSGLSYYAQLLKNDLDRTKVGSLEINIFEIGLGSGLNCLLSILFALKNKDIQINYSTIEKFPVSDDEFNNLNHTNSILNSTNDLSETEIAELMIAFRRMQQSKWGVKENILSNFSLLKKETDLLSYKADNLSFDIIYFDAFSPNTQPDLWSRAIFSELFDSLKPGGILVTYCSKGIVKQTLRDSGFEIKRLQGPLGKRHIIRATRPQSDY